MNSKSKIYLCLLALSLLAISPACSPAPASPVATSAPTVAATSAPALTPAPIETPTVTPYPTSGVAVEKQPDGSTVFFDFDNGYRVTFPPEWSVVPLSGLDLVAILEAVAKSNPELEAATAGSFGDTEPETFRAISLYPKQEFVTDGFAPNIGIVRIDDPLAAKIPMNYLLPNVVADREQDGTVTGSEIRENADGLKIGIVNVETDSETPSGATIPTVQRVAVFQTGNVAIALALTVQAEFSEQLLPTADAVIASIQLLQ
jgi:hypothetical protein